MYAKWYLCVYRLAQFSNNVGLKAYLIYMYTLICDMHVLHKYCIIIFYRQSSGAKWSGLWHHQSTHDHTQLHFFTLLSAHHYCERFSCGDRKTNFKSLVKLFDIMSKNWWWLHEVAILVDRRPHSEISCLWKFNKFQHWLMSVQYIVNIHVYTPGVAIVQWVLHGSPKQKVLC